MKKITVIIYGPPGSGKGTQANLLAEKLGLIHFDTGKYIEQVVHDPANKNDKKIQAEGKLFDSGILCTPSWVLKIVKEKTEQIAKSNSGIIFSGSPRTLFEAYGDKNISGLISLLEKLYNRKNIFIFSLKVGFEDSFKRNTTRLVCSVCGGQIMGTKGTVLNICPFCGGKLRKRTLDDPKVIKIRWKEYQKRTKPITDKLKKHGYKIISISGTPLPYKVHQNIIKHIK